MPAEVIMPKLGMGMEKGTVVEWVKAKYEKVSKGDVVVIVSSDKIEIEVEAPADGMLLDISVPAGEEVPVGTVIGYIGQEGEEISGSGMGPNGERAPVGANQAREEVSATATLQVSQDLSQENGQALPIKPPREKGNKSRSASPVARKLAREAGIDLSSIEGTGPNGRITKEDVERAISSRLNGSTTSRQMDAPMRKADPSTQGVSDSEPAPHSHEESIGSRQKVAGIRKVIAERMVASLQHSAQVTMTASADVTELLQLKSQIDLQTEQRYGVKPSLSAYIARSVVLALIKNQAMNSVWDNGNIVSFNQVHLGIAVALDKGLVVPVIRNAERLSVGHLAQSIKQVSEKARAGQLTSEEMQGSTFTITNLGQYGVEWFTPILNPPETGILGIGATHIAPVYVDGQWEARQMLPLSLTFDHRILDGAPAAQFLQEVKKGLENPLQLLI